MVSQTRQSISVKKMELVKNNKTKQEKPMYSNNKEIRDVADVAARIMAGLPPLQEKLHPNQQKIDVHEPEKDKITAHDFKKLRAMKKTPDGKITQLRYAR